MPVTRRAVVAALGASALSVAARAQESGAPYPVRPVQVVVPFPPAGTTDVMARLVADHLRQQWGQPVVLENRSGATGAIGAEYVSRAAPDGYTLLVGTASVSSVLPSARPDAHLDTLRDFRAVTMLATFPNMLVVHPSLPVHSVGELIELLRANPDRYDFGSSGSGGTVHLAGELFQVLSGTRITHVPYRGSAPAVADLLAGHVQIMFDNMATVWPYVQQGQLRVLGVTSAQRSPLAPDVPAIAEVLPGYEASSWVGILAPVRTPDEVVQVIASSIDRARHDPAITTRFRELGAELGSGSPADFATFLRGDVERWGRLVRQVGARLGTE